MPFQNACTPLTKFAPVSMIVKGALPTGEVGGVAEVIEGTGLVTTMEALALSLAELGSVCNATAEATSVSVPTPVMKPVTVIVTVPLTAKGAEGVQTRVSLPVHGIPG